MKIAYLIIAHKNPKLIRKTVNCLSCEGVSFFVHIDAKFSLSPFACLEGENVFFTKTRMPVYWGEFSVTEAVLLLMREALAAPQRYDYFVLLSGSEFPLRSGRYIKNFLKSNRGCEFITLAKMPAPGKPLSRLNTLRFPSTRPVLRFIFRVLAKANLGQRDYRKHLGSLQPYSGNLWWALTREACQYIIDFSEREKSLATFLKDTHASDECYFQTILGNSPLLSQVRRNLLYEDWPVEGPQHHPQTLSEKHIEYFESQSEVPPNDTYGSAEMLFARKFSDANLHLVERLAKMIEEKEKI